ncbi:hypothetical protein K2173_017065 [Erythroxylum novogranatense]|uniref:RING-type E3 ubiquitin transferase n=1 Tax=Erythroxylum novogranatense TaxID=1862640 RepID=A0AAV8U8W8_9ROSI|nr:hypothetical protein K2173_017065 [Erythroxylum novogranatense]
MNSPRRPSCFFSFCRISQLSKDEARIATVAEALLKWIAEIIKSLESIDVHHESFAEISCYLYRTCPAILELQATEHAPENTMDIFASLTRSIHVVRDLADKYQRFSNSNSDSDVKSIILVLEEEIKNMGECLSWIPSSTFQDQTYAGVAISSLSNEMRTVQFCVREIQVSDTKELEPQQSLKFLSTDIDLYPVSSEISSYNSEMSDKPQLIEFLQSTTLISQRKHSSSGSSSSLPQIPKYIEPLYDTFYCPLTKQIMEDPVTLETGVTCERKAIEKLFEEFGDLRDILCPVTGQKLSSRSFATNMALKTTIQEWIERNEAARIKVSLAALSLDSSAAMILEAIIDLQGICKRKIYNRVQVCNGGIVPLLVKFMGYKDRNVRCATLELLKLLAEDNEERKQEMIVNAMDISTVFKLLSSGYEPITHAALMLLVEISTSPLACERIGKTTGGILMLIRTKYNNSVDAFSSEKADKILKNLESSPENIKRMAENGFLEPLLNHLTDGSEETQMEMANYFGETALGHDSKIFVAEKASQALIKMVQSGNTLSRRAAFRALAKISSYHPNAEKLVKAGIVQTMVEELFMRRIYDEPMNTKEEAAAVLANIFEAGFELDNVQVKTYGCRLNSDYVVHNIMDMVGNSYPEELNINLIRVLLCLTKSPKSMYTITSAVRETEASYTLIELLNNPHEKLVITAIKLLISLSPYIGHILIERLCKISGQPENLILGQNETTTFTEKQAVSAKFLANLPHQNLTLNLFLIRQDTVPKILATINEIQKTGTRTSRFATPYLEGLVGILVRFTATLHDSQILYLARSYNFTSVFTELLMKTSSDEVQRLSAIGLENLSSESINLSRPPTNRRNNSVGLFLLQRLLCLGSSKKKMVKICPIHRGECSSENTFCLLEVNAVERLLACLHHDNAEVVEASLSALCTLLDEKVDVDKSVNMLLEVNAIQYILNVVKEHNGEGLRQKSFWVIERFLMKGGDKSASDISQDRLLPAILIMIAENLPVQATCSSLSHTIITCRTCSLIFTKLTWSLDFISTAHCSLVPNNMQKIMDNGLPPQRVAAL